MKSRNNILHKKPALFLAQTTTNNSLAESLLSYFEKNQGHSSIISSTLCLLPKIKCQSWYVYYLPSLVNFVLVALPTLLIQQYLKFLTKPITCIINSILFPICTKWMTSHALVQYCNSLFITYVAFPRLKIIKTHSVEWLITLPISHRSRVLWNHHTGLILPIKQNTLQTLIDHIQ